nr:PREDICTED: uncharacterized protein LOC107077309 [Lepisosteus oculatus]
MFRFFLLSTISVFLSASTARPHLTWEEVDPGQYQDVVLDLDGKLSVDIRQIEPPEGLAITDEDVHPGMAIWKAVRHVTEQAHLKAEEDRDDLDHPFSAEHLAQALGPRQSPELGIRNAAAAERRQEADELYHAFPRAKDSAQARQDAEFHLPRDFAGLYASQNQEPEDDVDHIHHPPQPGPRHNPAVQTEPVSYEVKHQPEEDRDPIYHGV